MPQSHAQMKMYVLQRCGSSVGFLDAVVLSDESNDLVMDTTNTAII
jgi:hypothetical protein